MKIDNRDCARSADRSITTFYATNSQGDGNVSSRFNLRDPLLGWVRIAKVKVEAITNCELVMPEYAGMKNDIACAYVEMLFKKPIRFVRLEREIWPFRYDGVFDIALSRQWIRNKLNDATGSVESDRRVEFDGENRKAIRAALRLVL